MPFYFFQVSSNASTAVEYLCVSFFSRAMYMKSQQATMNYRTAVKNIVDRVEPLQVSTMVLCLFQRMFLQLF